MSLNATNPISSTGLPGMPAMPPMPPAAKAAANSKAGPAAGKTGEGASALGPSSSAADQSNRFLKLLVAQMGNQDPLNPMDSAQVTSQMAQISTVEGVQTLNTTVGGLNAQFAQLQAMQGVSLVGREVAVPGDALHVDPTTHQGEGGFQLDSAATDVKVDILDAAGQSLGTVRLGPQPAGRHSFNWDVPEARQGQALKFKVSASKDTDEVPARTLQHSAVTAVSSTGGKLSLELEDGRDVGYDDVQAFL